MQVQELLDSKFTGNVLSEQEVEYGKDASEPEIPEIEGYEFISWDNSFENVKNNIEINAIYDLLNIFTNNLLIILILHINYYHLNTSLSSKNEGWQDS